MRFLADSNIVAQAVRAMRAAGHDAVYVCERPADPGDDALLAEAVVERRIFVTKDHDIGTLVHRDLKPHSAVLLIADLGNAQAESDLILAVLTSHGDLLIAGAFLKVSDRDVRVAQSHVPRHP